MRMRLTRDVEQEADGRTLGWHRECRRADAGQFCPHLPVLLARRLQGDNHSLDKCPMRCFCVWDSFIGHVGKLCDPWGLE